MTQDILTRNNVKIMGNGDQTIVFAHGFGCDQNMWRLMVPHFENNYNIVLFDYVGSGKADATAYQFDRYRTLEGYTQDLLEILETLKLTKMIYIGHSVSSMVGLLASIKNPDLFERIIMIGPSPRYINELPDYYGGFEKKDINELLDLMEMNFVGWASYLAPIAMNNPDSDLLHEIKKSFCSGDPAITRQFAEAVFFSDHRKDLEEVTIPSLILQCSEDSIVPVEVGKYMHQHLENSTFEILDVKGHYPHLSHPEVTLESIKNYLA